MASDNNINQTEGREMKKFYNMSNDGAEAYFTSATKTAKEVHGILSRAATHYRKPIIKVLDKNGDVSLAVGSMANLTEKDIREQLTFSGEFRAEIGSREILCVELEVK